MKWTIRRKFFISFLAVFTFAFIVLNYFLSNMMEKQMLATIENDTANLQYTSREYVKQFQQLHSEEIALFKQSGQELTTKLSELYNQSVALYTADGRFITEATPINEPLLMTQKKHEENITTESEEALQLAFQNRAAFMVKAVTKGTVVTFAYPVYIQDTLYGVIRFTGDYTSLVVHNEKLLIHFRLLALVLFFSVFCITLLLTQKMIKPLKQLTVATKQLANRSFETVSINASSDEIGELAQHFTKMHKEVNRYITEIEEEKEKVLQLEKQRTVLFQNVTHELKTPLTTISGYAQIIGEDYFDDPAFLQKAAHKIYDESTRLNDMVNKLLTFSKAQSGIRQFETFDVAESAKLVVEDLSIAMNKPIAFSAKSLYIAGVRTDIQQVLLNCISNAVKHGEQPISVEIGEVIRIHNRCEAISQDILDHLFEPFVHRKHKESHGLGLFIAKQLIELNNGTLSFTYKNKIVTVEISLPTSGD